MAVRHGASSHRFAAAALLSTLPLAASAEITNDALLGLGVRSRPAYDGSRSQRLEVVPVLRYLGDPWFLRSTQGVLEAGARVDAGAGLHAGAQLAYEPGRQASEAAFLREHQVADIARGVSAGVQLEWDQTIGPMPLTLLARARQHTGSNLGAQVDLRLSAGAWQSGAFSAGVFAQSTWANAKSARAYYGIDAGSAATTGLPAFEPGSGWLYASGGLLWSFDFSRQWVAVGNLEARRLLGDAAHSPLVQRRTNAYASAGLAYRF